MWCLAFRLWSAVWPGACRNPPPIASANAFTSLGGAWRRVMSVVPAKLSCSTFHVRAEHFVVVMPGLHVGGDIVHQESPPSRRRGAAALAQRGGVSCRRRSAGLQLAAATAQVQRRRSALQQMDFMCSLPRPLTASNGRLCELLSGTIASTHGQAMSSNTRSFAVSVRYARDAPRHALHEARSIDASIDLGRRQLSGQQRLIERYRHHGQQMRINNEQRMRRRVSSVRPPPVAIPSPLHIAGSAARRAPAKIFRGR